MEPKVLKPKLNYRAIFHVFLISKITVLACICTLIIFYYAKIVDQPIMDEANPTSISFSVENLTPENLSLVVENVKRVTFENELKKNPERETSEDELKKNTERVTLEDELKKNPDCPIENFYSIREWIQNEPQLPTLSDERLFQFLFACYYDMKHTKECIEIYLQLKSTSPEFFCNRDISDPGLQKALAYNTIFTGPVLTPEDQYRITFLRIDSEEASNFDFNNTVKLFFMAYDAELYVNGTAKGHITVFDFKNCGFRHMTKTSLDAWKKLIRLTQGGMPVRRKTLHVLNTNFFAYRSFQILKPFISPVIFESIHLHRPNELEDFYKFVPKECLPSDYGGSLESADVLKKQFEKDIWRLRKFFNQDDNEIICKDTENNETIT